MGRQRIAEVEGANQNIQWHWHTQLPQEAYGGDLCVIATQAAQRFECFKTAVITAGYRRFLLEKIVTQSIGHYQEMLELSKRLNVQVWVNCKSRAYGIHQYIKKIIGQDTVQVTITAGNHGLSNNGIHEVDLFQFYDGSTEILTSGHHLDLILHGSKRGSQVFDLSGVLIGHTARGSRFSVDFAKDHMAPDTILIQTAKARFIVDHYTKYALESYAQENWNWKQVPIHERWEVSIMTEMFVRDILTKGQCLLPSLEDCYPAHEFILGQLLPTFRELLNNPKLDYCPVT